MPSLMQILLASSLSVILMASKATAWSPVPLMTLRTNRPTSSNAFDYKLHRLLMAEHDEDDDDDDRAAESGAKYSGYNVLGTELSCCCSDVGGSGIGTGFYRNGFCSTGEMDLGRHTACVQVTDDFLEFSKSVGNDLSTPMPQYHFPGLKEGDIWCLCAQRWAQAYNAGKAPRLFLQATHEKTLDYIPLEVLKVFAIDVDESNVVSNELNAQRTQLNELFNKDVQEGNDSFQ